MRDWVDQRRATRYYLLGSVLGPHPYPLMVREFQSVIGREARAQCLEPIGRLPDAIVACVGGGSNAIGIFDAFIDDRGVRLIGVEAGGRGIAPGDHAARFAGGSAGVLQGTRSYVLQDDDGNIELTHSISAGLDYAAVGPEHAWLHDSRPRRVHLDRRRRGARRPSSGWRARRASCRRSSRRTPSRTRCRLAPGLRRGRRSCSSTCRAAATRTCISVQQALARRQGDADVAHRRRPSRALRAAAARRARHLRDRRRSRSRTHRREILVALARAGADVLEVGVPFSDPLADGPVIQRATERALAARHDAAGHARRRPPRARARSTRRSCSSPTRTRSCAWASRVRARGGRRRRGRRAGARLCRSRRPAPLASAAAGRRARSDLPAQPDDDRRADSPRRASSDADFST